MVDSSTPKKTNNTKKLNQLLLHSCSRGCEKSVESCLLQGAEVNYVMSDDEDGLTPLLVATRNNNIKIVSILLIKRANVNAKSTSGSTALHIASHQGHMEMIKMLLQHDASRTMQDSWGYTPLHWAAFCGFFDVVEILLSGGTTADTAGVNIQTKEGLTALHIVSQTGYFEIAEMLVKYGADIHKTNHNQNTALHHHIAKKSSNKPEIEEFFLNIKNNDNYGFDSKKPYDEKKKRSPLEESSGYYLSSTFEERAAEQQKHEITKRDNEEEIGFTEDYVLASPQSQLSSYCDSENGRADLVFLLQEIRGFEKRMHCRLEKLEGNLTTQISSLAKSLNDQLGALKLSIQDKYSTLSKIECAFLRCSSLFDNNDTGRNFNMELLLDKVNKMLHVDLLPKLKAWLVTIFTDSNNRGGEGDLNEKINLILETVATMKHELSNKLDKLSKNLSLFYLKLDVSMKNSHKKDLAAFMEVKKALEQHLSEITKRDSVTFRTLMQDNNTKLTETLKALMTNSLHEEFYSLLSDILFRSDNQMHALEKIIRKMEQMDEDIANRLDTISSKLGTIELSLGDKLKSLEDLKDIILEEQKLVLLDKGFDESKLVSKIIKSFNSDLSETLISALTPILRARDNSSDSHSSQLQKVINMIETLQEGLYARIDALPDITKQNLDKLHSCLRDECFKPSRDGQNAVLTILTDFIESHVAAAKAQTLITSELQNSFNQFVLSSKQPTALMNEDKEILCNMYEMIEKIITGSEKHNRADTLNQADLLDMILGEIRSIKAQVGELHQFNLHQLDALSEIHAYDNVLPHLFCILPHNVVEERIPKDKSIKQMLKQGLQLAKSKIMKPLWESSRLFFICPVLLKTARSGPDREGYEISVPTELCKTIACAIKLGLLILNVALASQSLVGNIIEPLRNLFPWIDMDTVDDFIKQLPVDQIQQGIVQAFENNEESNSAMRSIFKLVAKAENATIPVDLMHFKPQYTGLKLVLSKRGISGWVCDEELAISNFDALGKDAYRSLHKELADVATKINGNGEEEVSIKL